MRQWLLNGQVFDGDILADGLAVLLRDGVIDRLTDKADEADADQVIDLDGGLLAPGFIDCQVNGGGGVMFNDEASPAALARMTAAHRAGGSTGLLATLISAEVAKMRRAADAVAEALADGLPGLLGLHFEGPFLNPERRGAHGLRHLGRPTQAAAALALFGRQDLGRVLVTLAPEIAGNEIIAQLTRAGVRVSGGHSAAGYDETLAAIGAGLSCFTHLFNAMPAMASRQPGLLAAALEDDRTWCGLIADGHHVDPAMMRLAQRAKAAGKLMLVTDALACVGANVGGPPDSFSLDGEVIELVDGVCRTADGTLAGSNLTMAQAVGNAVAMLRLPLPEALRMAALYPAQFLGLDHDRGRIAAGYRADLVLLDSDLRVRRSWIAGDMQAH